MKSVLISIQPKWCELIASGKKTVEVRKTKPKIEVPFKCYIYCTNAKGGAFFTKGENGNYAPARLGNGKIVGECVCDEVTPLFNVATTQWNLLAGNVHEYAKALVRMARLTEEEMHSYANGKNCYAWHISDLKIYDKPIELSEFYVWKKCNSCRDTGYESTACMYDEDCKVPAVITRPPQSWCYVEDTE
jgi:predicted transcriptional regulator